ncbi:hypothetical protein E1162_01735 [Rhodobacteraceae bacterium RKSG542]|uniref:DMT family transporter n=1 Tax=Pseudovibrio flavus TaxID=2529854 RepID=UPI0012BB6617|nr:DMT family transporter [Pseudovibrio flavus]MTI15954.1 hypothetical protein [Pseudovibrio flavus]
MSLLGFALVFTAALCHATWNYYVKRINAGGELVWLFSAFAAVIYLPPAAYFFIQAPQFGFVEVAVVCISAALHIGYFLLLQAGYRHGDLSQVYPTARATGPMISTTLAVILLGESMSLQMIVGAVVIIFGIFMLTGGIKSLGKGTGVSIGFGIGSGLFIGSYTVWDAYAVSTLMIAPLLLDYFSNIARAVMLSPLAFRRRSLVSKIWREHKGGVLIISVFSPLAYILVLIAFTFTPVVYVAPLRELSVLMSVLMGSILLGEGHLKERMVWAMVIVFGVLVLASS